MVQDVDIKAKVLKVHPKGNNEWVLLVLIKELFYTRIGPQDKKHTGKVVFDDFHQKAKFNIIIPNFGTRMFEAKLFELVYGDVINFSLTNGIAFWVLSSLELGKEECLDNSLEALIMSYGQED